MRKLITTTFVTLDGVMQAPGGPKEDPSGNFQYGGWSFPYWADEVGAFMDDTWASRSTCCLAVVRTTFSPRTGHKRKNLSPNR
jgi:hypothetical protein